MKKNIIAMASSLLLLVPAISFAEESSAVLGAATGTKEITSSTTTLPVKTFTLCSQEAIETRDTAIATSRQTYNVTMANALTERKNREKAAVAISDEDERKDAIKASVDAYKHQAKIAQTALTQARKSAWQTFDNDVKKCRELESDDTMVVASTTEDQPMPAMRTMSSKKMSEDIKESKTTEAKTFKDTIKYQIESLKSLFN